ncbi:MAG: phosphate acyltransferase [Martelella sp.]
MGPLLVGLEKPVQIVSLGARDADIGNMAAMAAYSATIEPESDVGVSD